MLLLEHAGSRIQPARDAQAGGCGGDRAQAQVGAVLLQCQHQPPDISAPEFDVALALRGKTVKWIAVVDQYRRARDAVLLDVDEIPQGKLEMMHAVYEGEVDRHSAQLDAHVVPGEILVAGHCVNGGPCAQRMTDDRLGIDADRARLRMHQAQGLARFHADLDIGPRTQVRVNQR